MEEEITCALCETEFTLTHAEEDTVEYCTFCGNLLEQEIDGFEVIDEEPYED